MLLSTDATHRFESSFVSSITNPLSSFYKPHFDVTSSTSVPTRKYPASSHFNGGLEFFGKLTDSQLHINQSQVGGQFQFREFLDNSNGGFLPKPGIPSKNAQRYIPYSTETIKNRRLDKILNKSVKGIDQLSPIPYKYAEHSLLNKLDRLKNLIGALDQPIDKRTTERSSYHLESLTLSTSLMKGFNPAGTSTPMLIGGGNVPKKTLIPRTEEQIAKETPKEQKQPPIIDLTQPETPPSSKVVGLEKPTTSARPLTIEQQWREKKYNDERESRQREAEELEKEIRMREKARYNRLLEEEQNRRLRLQLEGLILERRVPPKEEFPVLSDAVKQMVKIIWNKSLPHDEVFATGFGADITRKDLLTLSGLEWLNDEVINFFLNLIVERNQNDSSLPKVYTFNTFFFQKLSSNGYSGVKRWTRKVDIFANDILIVPVHLPNHWCMAIIDLRENKIDYYDSMFGNNEQCLELLSDYLCQESLDKRKQPFPMDGWEKKCRKDIPRQTNFSDCGMFSCIFAEYASRRAPITFDQKHIPYFRERIVYEICQKRLF